MFGRLELPTASNTLSEGSNQAQNAATTHRQSSSPQAPLRAGLCRDSSCLRIFLQRLACPRPVAAWWQARLRHLNHLLLRLPLLRVLHGSPPLLAAPAQRSSRDRQQGAVNPRWTMPWLQPAVGRSRRRLNTSRVQACHRCYRAGVPPPPPSRLQPAPTNVAHSRHCLKVSEMVIQVARLLGGQAPELSFAPGCREAFRSE